MSQAVADLIRRLDLTQRGKDEFEGENEPNSWGRLFGGMVAAQALVAACRTVDTDPARPVHSLHAYFLRPGDPNRNVEFAVDRIRDGKSFTTRRVVASQGGKAIFNMAASFQVIEDGYAHQQTMPAAPAADDMIAWRTLAEPIADGMSEPQRSRFLEPRPIDLCYLHAPTFLGGDAGDGGNQVRIRASSPLPKDDRLLHWAFLTYASDMSLLDNIVRPHGRRDGSRPVQLASLDHAVWFHHPDLSMNEWLLYQQDSPIATGARGLARGSIYDGAGRLVVSVAQEGLMRPVKHKT